jgi:predicted permease
VFEHLPTILSAMFGSAVLLLIGALARRLGVLRPAFDRAILKVIVRGLMPALVFSVVAGNEKLRDPLRVMMPPLVGFMSILLGFAVAAAFVRACRRWLGMSPPAERTFVFTTGVYNYGYIPIPIVLLLFGDETLSVLFLHNTGIDLAFWTVGVLIMTGHFSGRVLLKAVNPPSVAIVVGLVCNWSGMSDHIPAEVIDSLNVVGKVSLPLGLLLIGATVTDHLHEAGLRQGLRVIAAANLLRLGIIPVLFLVAARFLPCSMDLKRVIVVQAAMPAGVFAIIMARHYHGDTPTAMRVILTTNVICLITAPLWLPVGMWFVGVTQ